MRECPGAVSASRSLRATSMANQLKLRPGRPTDAAAILDLWDDAVAWLVGRGQTGQWGSEAASARPQSQEMVQRWTAQPGSTVAELGEQVVGLSVTTPDRPNYVPAIPQRESYLLFLLSSRDHAGNGIGSMLVRDVAARARTSGSELLRVDCWAEATGLVRWYEREGFRRSASFAVGGWRGQVFEMAL